MLDNDTRKAINSLRAVHERKREEVERFQQALLDRLITYVVRPDPE